MNRETLLAWRDHTQPCEHERYGHYWDTAVNAEPVWKCAKKDCPGGAAIVTECETCGGSGEELVDLPVVVDNRYISCLDCVDGLTSEHGTIIQWCETHYGTCINANPIKLETCVIGYRLLSDRIGGNE